jgi:hypothetical protein
MYRFLCHDKVDSDFRRFVSQTGKIMYDSTDANLSQ